LLETDLDGNIRRAKLIYNGTLIDDPDAGNLFVNADNSMGLFNNGRLMAPAVPALAHQSYWLRLDSNMNILSQNSYPNTITDNLVQAVADPAMGLTILGQKKVNLFSVTPEFSENLILLKVDSNGAGPGTTCDVFPSTSSTLDMMVSPISPGTPQVIDQTLQVTNYQVTATNSNSGLGYNCTDYIPPCSFLKLSGKNFVCNLTDTLDIFAHKDPSCPDPILWNYDVTNISTVYQDGIRRRLLFKKPGVYTINAEKTSGCFHSYDSIIIHVEYGVKIFGADQICKGQTLKLDAGSGFTGYLWQDGSRNESFAVTDTGFYRVQVTDQYQCISADSIDITTFSAGPQNFLPADTTICANLTLLIHSIGVFAQYNWSTGEITNSIQVKTAGTYTLEVVNQQGCHGRDTIIVKTQECDALLVFPNAFTPNNDGLNDVFRVKYPGYVSGYHIQIFSQAGQLMYQSSDVNGQWDGSYHGTAQPTGTYIWIANYTDHNGNKQKITGTVTLIR
jgi:gliding motility-associated-like protein